MLCAEGADKAPPLHLAVITPKDHHLPLQTKHDPLLQHNVISSGVRARHSDLNTIEETLRHHSGAFTNY